MMLKATILLVIASLLSSNNLRPQNRLKPIWDRQIYGSSALSYGVYGRGPQNNRSCGIAEWDESHLLVYSLNGRLGTRKSNDPSKSSWYFSIRILNSDTGKIERSFIIPAGSRTSQLALVAGGIVESDPGHLTFYSRNFQQLDRGFTYTPLDTVELLGTESVTMPVYASPDQQHFMLVDRNGHRSRFFLFDGSTFRSTSSAILDEVDYDSISLGNRGFFYTNYDRRDNLYYGNFEGKVYKWPTAAIFHETCYLPIYIDTSRILNVCRQISIVTHDRIQPLYHIKRHEITLGPAVISTHKDIAAVFTEIDKGGGFFDTEVRQVGAKIVIVHLDGEGAACEIPAAPPPRVQLAFAIINNSKLAILNDGTISAYDISCSR